MGFLDQGIFDSDQWTTSAPTEPDFYWIIRKDGKAVPVEVGFMTAMGGGSVIPQFHLKWRGTTSRSWHDLEDVLWWGPRLRQMPVPEHVRVDIALNAAAVADNSDQDDF